MRVIVGLRNGFIGVQTLFQVYRFGFSGGVSCFVFTGLTTICYGLGLPIADMTRKQLLQEHETGVFLQAALERFGRTC